MKKRPGPVLHLLALFLAIISLAGSDSSAHAAPPSKASVSPSSALPAPPGSKSSTSPKASEKTFEASLIKQSNKFFGEQILLVCQIGIKTCNSKSSVCMIMTPPFETATVYNKSTKKYFQAPVKAMRCPMQKTFALFNAYVLGEAPMEKIGTGQLDGFNVVKYRTTKAFEVSKSCYGGPTMCLHQTHR